MARKSASLQDVTQASQEFAPVIDTQHEESAAATAATPQTQTNFKVYKLSDVSKNGELI